MKYIFRYALLTTFTEKDTLITKQQLSQALKTAKYPTAARDIDTLVSKHAECISLLLKSGDRRDWEAVLRDSFEKEELTDNDVNELLNVWENERHLVFKKQLNNNCKSSCSYQGVGWTLRNAVAGRRSPSTSAPSLALQLKDKHQVVEAALTREEFGGLAQQVRAASSFLGELFQNG